MVTIPVLVLNLDEASAQSGGRKTGGAIQTCYNSAGKSVRCDQLGADNKKTKSAKDKTK
jgi:hypothetical protein